MKDKVFIDTNILIYAYSNNDILKKNLLVSLLNEDIEFIISTQVVNEFINVMHKKLKINYIDLSNGLVEIYSFFDIKVVNIETIHLALDVAHKYKYSYFDSLMIASALQNQCCKIFSEDMHDKQIIQSLEIVNPFLIKNP